MTLRRSDWDGNVLTTTQANSSWIKANHEALEQGLPAPGRCWRWSDTDLSHSTLCNLRNRELIKQCNDGREGWKTTKKCWHALERYGDANKDDRGVIVGQESLTRYIK